MNPYDHNESPYIVIWEVTRACELKCLHCRAEAIPKRDPRELTLPEGRALLTEIRRFGTPVVVLTGGDPAMRPDLFDLISCGTELGLKMTMTPSGTPRMTREILERSQKAGLMRLAVSLDGSTPEIHDAFRGVPGSHAWTLSLLAWARELSLSTQVNTTITRRNLADVPSMITLLERQGISLWSVFFLVPTGRGKSDDAVTAEQHEEVFELMYQAGKEGRFDVKSTAAPHYRRYFLQRQVQDRASSLRGEPVSLPPADAVGRSPRAVNDGNGFVFISHTGEIYPSGFLPVLAGNVRQDSLVTVYRESPLFRSLRDQAALQGKCGACEYKRVCGGSRAQAYAWSGDVTQSDPSCAYIPRAWGS